jgi:hypothetical protein
MGSSRSTVQHSLAEPTTPMTPARACMSGRRKGSITSMTVEGSCMRRLDSVVKLMNRKQSSVDGDTL